MSGKYVSDSYQITPGKRILIAGGGGFIGSHLARQLKKEGHWLRAVDWKENEYMKEPEFCDEFLNLDLRYSDACEKAVEGCDWCFNLAADMGGMGFIQSNHSRILYNSTMISFNVAEAARKAGTVKRFWYASSACIYPEGAPPDQNLLPQARTPALSLSLSLARGLTRHAARREHPSPSPNPYLALTLD